MSFELPLSEIYNISCLSEPMKNFMLEAVLLVFTENSHDVTKQISLKLIDGEFERFILNFDTGSISEKAKDCWEIEQATEKAAECIALIICSKLTQYKVIKRSRRKTGFDYWIGEKEGMLFQNMARLEISGILKGNTHLLERRFKEKSLQTAQSDDMGLPAYISVTEFSEPMTQFGLKKL
jgi:hypothetical protein